ncbi:protein IL-40 [Dipodomys spectabilis]|uniref:protein IL-40 n=1 Tax=Dipodomys spectabilis TaxID=105255 RepID=UPI001C534C49|nr:protein IL-40 [Dipodomys spectabilis]
MRLLPLLCLAMLAPSSFPKEEAEGSRWLPFSRCQEQPQGDNHKCQQTQQSSGASAAHTEIHCLSGSTPDISITYKVLQVYPQSRWVLITCHVLQAPPPITYSLLARQNTLVARRVINTYQPAFFSINVTLKSSPDLLTYSCQAVSASGTHGPSARLQMYWELWAKPVSQLQANFSLWDRGSGPRMEVSCQVSSGSPPITYRLVRKDGRVCMQQRPLHGQPANFSFQLSQTSGWYHCQAENSISALSSAFTLVPPGESALRGWKGTRPKGPRWQPCLLGLLPEGSQPNPASLPPSQGSCPWDPRACLSAAWSPSRALLLGCLAGLGYRGS